MLYNDDFLKPGQLFPPRSELSRLKGYLDNKLLFEGNTNNVLKPYIDRTREIIKSLTNDESNQNYEFIIQPNYWQLSTIKTGDLMIGDPPTISIAGNQDTDKTNRILERVDFQEKLTESVYDIDRCGESLFRFFIDAQGNKNFVVADPSTWFPVVESENIKIIKEHIFAWIVCVKQDPNHEYNNKYKLNVQRHYPGKDYFDFEVYDITGVAYKKYRDERTDEVFEGTRQFWIGKLDSKERKVHGIKNGAVIHMPGVTTSDNLHGISNYERMTEIAAEIAVRTTLGDFVLDQNSAPRMAAPSSAFTTDKDGTWKLKTSGRNFVVEPDGMQPVYITWTGNLVDNENAIKRLKKELIEMTEMGPVIDGEEMNSSQGFDALNVKMTNPKLKVRRLSSKIIKPLKQLIAKLLCDESTSEEDIFDKLSITFNEGLPANEGQELERATKKKSLGFSFRTIAKEYFSYTDEQVDKEIENNLEENINPMMGEFGAARGADFPQEDDGGVDAT